MEDSQLCSCQEEQCVICRMEFEVGEDVKVLPCKHLFHPACVDQWLHINKVCLLPAHLENCTPELNLCRFKRQVDKTIAGTSFWI